LLETSNFEKFMLSFLSAMILLKLFGRSTTTHNTP
jgi:hypothetical protein